MMDKCNNCPHDFNFAIIDDTGEVLAYFNDYGYALDFCYNAYDDRRECFYIIPLKLTLRAAE